MKQILLFLAMAFIAGTIHAEKTVNVYVWGGEIPKQVIQQFEKMSGIKVNFSTYDSNETMYAKLRASRGGIYDVILPSAYFVERMKKQNILTKLDHSKLSNIDNIDPLFTNNDYDKGNHYSVPFIWGATGIFYNHKWVKTPPKSWKTLWEKRWQETLLLLDDPREIFSFALLRLGYSPNDTNPQHIKEAYQQLLALKSNIKLFASDSIQAVMIDEDAILGSVWNGDAFKAHAENKDIHFIFPNEGFVIWVDCLSIPRNAPHPEEAYQFINFLLKATIAAQVAQIEGHAIANKEGKALLSPTIRNNTMVYPPAKLLKRGYFQRDIGERTLALYNQYWQHLKQAF